MQAVLDDTSVVDQGLRSADLFASAASLIPSLRARASRISDNRTIPEDVVADLQTAGLINVMRPRRFGGHEASPDVFLRVGRELAKGDGSTAWFYLVTGCHDGFIALFPDAVQAEFWSSRHPLAAASFSPTGAVSPARDGYRLSGKWSFCTGIDQSGWVLVTGIAGMLESGDPDLRFFLVPETNYSIVDDWHVMGLCGTGSKSVILDDVYVPAERTVAAEDIANGTSPGALVSDNPILHTSLWTTFNFTLSAAATGVAAAAYEQTVQEQRGKIGVDPFFSSKMPAVQMHLAEADALIECSENLYIRALDDYFTRLQTSAVISDRERVWYRRNQTFSARYALKAVEMLQLISGARAMYSQHPCQRAMRDLFAINSHLRCASDSASLSFGAYALTDIPSEAMI